MASQAQTWQALQAIQAEIFQQVLVPPVTGVSPFTTWTRTADATKYGTNPFVAGGASGGVTTAIYIGYPKDFTGKTDLPRQCHIIPPMRENVVWHALGGKTWDIQSVYVRFVFSRKDDWYQAQQDLIAARDAYYGVLIKHANLNNAATVAARRFEVPQGAPQAFHHSEAVGEDWDIWGFQYWLRHEYASLTGVGS